PTYPSRAKPQAGRLYGLALGTVLFALTFGPKLIGVFDIIAITSAGLIGYHALKRRPVGAKITSIASLLAGLLAYSLTVTILSGTGDLFYAGRAGRALLNVLGAYVLCDLFRRVYGPVWIRRVIEVMFWVITVHAVVMIVMYVYPALGEAIYTVTLSVEPQAKIMIGWRSTGLTEGLGTTSVTQSVGILLAPLLLALRPHLGERVLLLAGSAAIVVSIMISGRTGLFLAVPYVAIGSILALRIRPPAGGRSMGHLLIGLAVIAASGWVLYQALPEEARQRLQVITIPHALEGLYTLSEAGEFRIRSAEDVLEDQFFLPDSLAVLLFGTGESGRGAGAYVRSDVGYVRFIFGIGLIGSLLVYSFYLLVLLHARRAFRYAPILGWVTTISTLGFLAAHAKTAVALTRNGLTITSLLLMACILADPRRGLPPQASTSGVNTSAVSTDNH
ncbi:MAG: hypothetical protein QME77_10875, partial [bacterium]|nr:hypothetical protein [bacterium]